MYLSHDVLYIHVDVLSHAMWIYWCSIKQILINQYQSDTHLYSWIWRCIKPRFIVELLGHQEIKIVTDAMYMPYSRRPSESVVPISNSTVSGHAIVSINGDSSPTFVNSPVNWNNFATLDVFVKDDVLRGKSLFFTTIWQGCRFVPYTSSETIRHRWYLWIYILVSRVWLWFRDKSTTLAGRMCFWFTFSIRIESSRKSKTTTSHSEKRLRSIFFSLTFLSVPWSLLSKA